MIDCLHTLDYEHLPTPEMLHTTQTIDYLESGHVIYCPNLPFKLLKEEQPLLTPTIGDTQKKNISYNLQNQKLTGLSPQHTNHQTLEAMMHRYALFAKELVDTLFPNYQSSLRFGRTSYRPIEVAGRQRSKRQDDTRLHVDAFPSTPVNGLRILRVFCNINPEDKPRVWHVGEPFNKVLTTFATKFKPYSAFKAKLLHRIKATKILRSAYDHYMLSLHDLMKLDDNYQENAPKKQIDFAAQSTWVVFTDHVSHAALGGQYLLEQTFYLPVSAMSHPELSPLRQIDQLNLKSDNLSQITY